MLIICKDNIAETQSAERIFNSRIELVKAHPEVLKTALSMFGYTYESGCIQSAFGTGDLTDIKIACKLAICLQLFPALQFDTYGVSERDLCKVLTVDTGRLVCLLREPLHLYKSLCAQTESGVRINDTTELNLYVFG